MDRLMPRSGFRAVIEPPCPKAGNGRPPADLERVPDATTLLHFRHLLEKHGLGAAPSRVGALLLDNGMEPSGGTIVNATSIAMPLSIRNQEKTEADRKFNRRKSGVRSKAECPFLALRRPRGFAKVRSRSGEECQPGFRQAGDAQHQPMPASDGRGVSGMSGMRQDSLHPDPKQPDFSMEMAFPSRFRIDFSSPPNFALACSAVP